MLYITTRNRTDSYTAHRTLREGFAPDGGQFVPICFPVFERERIEQMKEKSFCQNVADVLNVFFSAQLTMWDIEFAIGRRPVKTVSLGRKLMVAELWQNTEKCFQASQNRIYHLLCGQGMGIDKANGWVCIAIRIAFLFGIYAEISNNSTDPFDVAVAGKDFESAVSVMYARKMGLPIEVIICGCNENCGIWDLLYKGQLDAGASTVVTDTKDMDCVAPLGFERLIFENYGLDETLCYLQAVSRKQVYQIPADRPKALRQNMFASVVGRNRVKDVISSVYRTNQYLIDPYMAVAYGALQDYKTKTGANHMTLLLSEENPSQYADLIGSATGLSRKEICK